MSKQAGNRGAGQLRRHALCAALVLSLATGPAFAQSAVGSVFGTAKAGASVTLQNIGSGSSRTITADSEGRYTFNQLPPGDYTISADGVSRSTHVSVGTGTEVSLETRGGGDAKTLDAVTVTGSNVKSIDVSSVESSMVLTAQELQKLPVEREISSVAMLAPGVVEGDDTYGRLVSIGGASVGENGYFVNGFDITNPRNMMSYFDIPYEAVGEAQVKTGGYGAEYGRSLGGVLGQVTKRGTNEWDFGGSVYWTPDKLMEPQVFTPSRRQMDIDQGRVQTSNKNDVTEYLKYNVYAGGPILKDRLFFFALLQGRHDTFEGYGRDTANKYLTKNPETMVKLDWNITSNHLLEFTGIHAPIDQSQDEYRRQTQMVDGKPVPINPFTNKNLDWINHDDYVGGGDVALLKYTGWFGDNFTLSAQAGRMEYINSHRTKLPEYTKCPMVWDATGPDPENTAVPIGCWNPDVWYYDDLTVDPTDIRDGFRIDGEWRAGKHDIKFGVDYEKIQSIYTPTRVSGGVGYAYYTPNGDGKVVDTTNWWYEWGGLPAGRNVVFVDTLDSRSYAYDTINTGIYIDDNWQVTENLLLYGGLRLEGFDNKDATGVSAIKAKNQWSPRLGFSWDVNGDSSFKVYGTLGRYYINAPGLLVSTKGGFWGEAYTIHTYDSYDPNTGVPTGLSAPLTFIDPDGKTVDHWQYQNHGVDARTYAAKNLKPMGQDELILGMQKQLDSDWTFGAKGIYRNVVNGMENFCPGNSGWWGPFVEWAHANGYPDYTVQDAIDTQQGCIYINPGVEPVIAMHADGDPNGPTVDARFKKEWMGLGEGLDRYKRRYGALELTMEKRTDRYWVSGSYTLSHSYGNTEGYVNSTLPGDSFPWIAQSVDFNHPIADQGGNGTLPNNRTHSLKVFGNFNVGEQWQLGGNFYLQSGKEKLCRGYSPYQRDDLANHYAPDGTVYPASPTNLPGGELKFLQEGFRGQRTNFCHDQPYAATWVDTRNTSDTSDDYTYTYTSFAPTLHPRGSMGELPWSWNFDFSAAYTPNWAKKKLSFRMNVFNLFNRHYQTSRNNGGDITMTTADAVDAGYTQTITRADGTVVTGANATPEELTRLARYAHGGVVGPNPNYGTVNGRQAPRYVTFSVRYDW